MTGTLSKRCDRQTDRRTDRRTDKQTDKRTDKRTDKQMDKRMDKRMDGLTNRWTDWQTDGQTDRQTDGRTNGQMDGLTDKRIDRRTDKHMDKGQTDRQTCTFWQAQHFQKAFKKFMTKFAKLGDSNQNTIIRHFHDFGVERNVKRERLQRDITMKWQEELKLSSETPRKILCTHCQQRRD